MSTTKVQATQEQEVTSKGRVEQRKQREHLILLLREQQEAINKALDETKNNIKRTTDEASKDIPHYTQIVNEYQEETIQAARQIADHYLESQREIINSFQSAWLPQLETANRAVTSNWTPPKDMSEHYAKLVSAFADNTIAVTKLVNSAMFANLDAFKRSVQNARDNVKEFSRIGVNSAKTFEEVSRDTVATTRTFSP
ncbi:MAG: hypothetical protein ACJ704_05200 [Nitrososphaeraceae archaeon]